VICSVAGPIPASELGLHAGCMLKEAQPFLCLAPTDGIFPGAAMARALLGCNLLEAGLRNLLDPNSTARRGGNGEVFGGDRKR
jgi:ABC-type dipeptide/oligopeptide/nickel transport system permease subunit